MKPLRISLFAAAILLELTGIVLLSAGELPVVGIALLIIGLALLVTAIVRVEKHPRP